MGGAMMRWGASTEPGDAECECKNAGVQALDLSPGFGDFTNTITTPETQAEHPNQRKLYILQNHTSTVLRE